MTSLLRPARASLIAMVVVAMAACSTPLPAADEAVVAAAKSSGGFQVHEVQSPFQKGTTLIRVLLPDNIPADVRLPTVYVLPVEAGEESRYGDGLKEIQTRNLHNDLGVAFVAPTFSQLPWYADHPSDLEIRQESHFTKVVVPFVERTYPVKAEANGRFLLGFSKSGWGAWSLLLRHPDMFSRAAAWDAPLMMDAPGKYGSGPIFGTPENFQKYCVRNLLADQADPVKADQRLILTGYGNFRAEHVQVHDLMLRHKIPHVYHDGPPRKHDWQSGWVDETVRLLVRK